MKLVIFSSSRAVRQFYEQERSTNALLPKALSVSEFLSQVVLHKDTHKRRASHYEALLCMQKACLACKKSEQVLKIPSNFFAFLKNYEYLFSFFKELVLAQKSVRDIKIKDTYALFDEHLDILDELFEIYLSKLDEAGLFDDLSLVKNYTLNLDFLKEFTHLTFHLDGFLNAFEEGLWSEISKEIHTEIIFKTSKFNIEFFSNLSLFESLSLKVNQIYHFDLSQNKLLSEDNFNYKADSIKLKGFELRSLQASFVYHEISEFIRAGLEPSKIALIVPDESFCTLLRLFDKNKMLNFASGISIKESLFYQRFKSLLDALNDEGFFYDDRDKKAYFEDESTTFDLHNSALKLFDLENFNAFKNKFNQKADFKEFEHFIQTLLKHENTELCNKINEELFYIKSLLKDESLSLKELFELFLMQIKPLSTSHIGGGEVRVLGLLEGRDLSFEGLIIVDFNEEFIPKPSVNSMFLNDKVRKNAGLISFEQRLSLQRFYYESLIKNARKISICYTQNEESVKSRLLDELDIEFTKDNIASSSYLKALAFNNASKSVDPMPLSPPKLRYNLFKKALSYSRFECFLKQKRTFFYKYILKIPEARALSLEPSALDKGIFLHALLEKFYHKNQAHFDSEAFIKLLENAPKKPFSRLDIELLKLEIQSFGAFENEHFKQGFCVEELELDFNEKPRDFKLLNGENIRLCGKIDRVDRKKEANLSTLDKETSKQEFLNSGTDSGAQDGANLFIIDYKSGKLPEKSSLQLAFYRALLGAPKAKAIFYSFRQMQAQGDEANSFETLEKELLRAFEECEQDIIFENSKDDKNYPYRLIYKKDLK